MNSIEDDPWPTLREFCLTHSSIVEPLLIFCTHALRWHDSRCCGIVLKVFRSIILDFATAELNQILPEGSKQKPPDGATIPPSTASAVREYICSDVMKACITSIHEPYFVELQKEFAYFIATIVLAYKIHTTTARDVLVSLPNMKEAQIDSAIEYMCRKGATPRVQRTVILQLLGDLKGVSVSEMGKLSKSIGVPISKPSAKRPPRSKMAQQFMTEPAPNESTSRAGGAQDGNTDNLEGVAKLFDS